jgi:hypothetical protein
MQAIVAKRIMPGWKRSRLTISSNTTPFTRNGILPERKPELIEKTRFQSTNIYYDPKTDEFTYPAQHPMIYQETKPYKTTTGYLSKRRFYECAHCFICPLNQSTPKPKAIGGSKPVSNFSAIANKPKKTCFLSKELLCARNGL